MKKFKIVFPSGYQVKNFFNDNVDMNILVDKGKVYAATAFTLANIQFIINENNYKYFWASDMFIVENLRLETLYNSVQEIFSEGYETLIFKEIGTIQEVYDGKCYGDINGFSG